MSEELPEIPPKYESSILRIIMALMGLIKAAGVLVKEFSGVIAAIAGIVVLISSIRTGNKVEVIDKKSDTSIQQTAETKAVATDTRANVTGKPEDVAAAAVAKDQAEKLTAK